MNELMQEFMALAQKAADGGKMIMRVDFTYRDNIVYPLEVLSAEETSVTQRQSKFSGSLYGESQ